MKRISTILIICLMGLFYQTDAQIKVDQNGNI